MIALTSLAALAAASPAAAEGFRAEIHGGWDRVANGDVDDDGIVYGIGLGYDVAVGKNAFIGIDLSADDSSQKECVVDVEEDGDELCVRGGRDLAAGIRAGFNVGESGKLYALAAYTNARFKAVYTDEDGEEERLSDNLDGLRIGAGYQHALAGNAYGKVEYRYSNYEAGTDRHQVLLGVGMTF